MSAIQVLADDLINAIAAGEVVERPASCAKELVENSLDAGASWVEVSYRQGGLSEISVRDNGRGIPAQEVALAFERHATSKLAAFSDLDKITTLGFRGEALPAIAQVSRLEMVTRTADEPNATRVVIEGGRLLLREKVAAASGTRVAVQDLFFNTPARLAHLRSTDGEGARLVQEMSRLALSQPGVGFRVTTDQRLVLATSGDGDLLAAAAAVWGLEVAEALVPIFDQYGEVTISGLVSRPHQSRANRQAQLAVVNGRAVNNPRLRYAAEQAYREHLMRGRFPYLVLCVDVPVQSVDPNVHPSKWEVRLRAEDELASHIYEACRRALGLERRPEMSRPAWAEQAPSAASAGPTPAHDAGAQIGFAAVRTAASATGLGPPPEAISQVNELFLVAVDADSLYLIDQHAAHERVAFEALAGAGARQAQLLLEPVRVRLLPEEAERLGSLAPELEEMGLEVAALGPGGEVVVRSLPEDLADAAHGEPLRALLSDLAAAASWTEAEERRRLGRLALAACRAAVKRGDRLTLVEQQALIDALWRCAEPRHCPHGRPVWLSLPLASLEHRLGRS